ncbi:MAG: OmpA family protein [Psychromonas sp.]|nr:OmpA family protein [Psychromonas sp.]
MKKIKLLKTFIESRGYAAVVIMLSLLLPFQLLMANEQVVSGNKAKVLIDRFIFNAGFSKALIKQKDTNGGVSGIKVPDDIGVGISSALIFNTYFKPYFNPYVDIATYMHNDRHFVIPGIGIRHDFNRDDDSWLKPFISTGVGYSMTKWRNSPAPGSIDESVKGKSGTWILQAGSDFYLSHKFALNLTARYDMYDINTSVIKDSQLSTLNDKGSLSLLFGITYRFGKHKNSQCPEAPYGAPVDSNGCALDTDKDGVIDLYDRCPDTLTNVPVTQSGCPPYRFEFALNYKFSKYKISDFKNKPIFDVLAFLKKHPHYHVKITGYADGLGSAKFNLALSQKRVKEVKKYLLQHGIEEARIRTIGRGETEPLVKNDSKDHRNMNRRILIEFYRIDKKLVIETSNKTKG